MVEYSCSARAKQQCMELFIVLHEWEKPGMPYITSR